MNLAFTCHRSLLVPLIERATKKMKKSNIPVLNNVLVSVTDEGEISVMGTDLDLSVTASAEGAEVEVAGAVSVESNLFFASVKRMPEGLVHIVDDGSRMTVRGGKANARLPTTPEGDHPRLDGKEPTCTFIIPSMDLAAISERCAFAMSAESVRYFLCGVYLHPRDDKLVAVATDGVVLSKCALDLPEGAKGMPGVILPDATVSAFSLLVGKKDAPVAVAISDGFIRFSVVGLTLTSKLIDGTFPDYERVVPRANDLRATVKVAEMTGAVERMLIYAPDGETRCREIKCSFTADSLEMFTRSEKGEASDEIAVEGMRDIIIGWSSSKLLDLLGSMDSEWATFAMADPTSPCLITAPGDDTREMIIMPARLNW